MDNLDAVFQTFTLKQLLLLRSLDQAPGKLHDKAIYYEQRRGTEPICARLLRLGLVTWSNPNRDSSRARPYGRFPTPVIVRLTQKCAFHKATRRTIVDALIERRQREQEAAFQRWLRRCEQRRQTRQVLQQTAG